MAVAIPFVIAAFTAYASIKQGEDAARAANMQRDIANENAELSRQSANAALQESAAEQAARNRQIRRFLGNQRAAAVEAGTGTGGSNEKLLEQSQTLSELDVLNVAYQGALRSRGFNIQGRSDENSASIYGFNAKASRRAGYLGAARSIISSSYNQFGPNNPERF